MLTEPFRLYADAPYRLEIDGPDRYAELVLKGDTDQPIGRTWTAADTLTVDVYFEAGLALPVRLRFGVGEYSNSDQVMTAAYGVLPGVRTRLTFPLSALNAETVFLPRTPGRLKATLQGRPSRPEDITWFAIGAGNVGRSLRVEFSNVTLTDAPQPLVPDGPILVDELGQWAGHDWPGKTPDVNALVAHLRSASVSPAPEPLPGRNRYGGSTDIKFDAAGFFRTHHDGHRWWLVDPDGGAFWSAGVDCVGLDGWCPVEGNEGLCGWLPSREGEYADAWRGGQFAWPVANLIRAFGPEWRDSWAALTRRSLSKFGFNTIGNWSDTAFARQSNIPYVLPLADFPTTAQTVFRDFPDVFAPEFAENARTFARQLDEYRDDPYLIGYFLRNEPLWAFGVFRLAEELLAHDPARAPHSRRALVEHLRSVHAGSAHPFEAAWGGVISRPEDLEAAVLADPAILSQAARDSLAGFSRRMVDTYVRIPSEACRAVDPNHLNLGMRWAWIASDDLLAGSDACDVFSMNCYDFRISPETVRKAAQASGRPVLIGEFHFGAIDRGLLSGGLRGVLTQADRGQAYRYYVEQAAALPDVIGAHYFQWNDQPFLGRSDGENWQIGLVDVCHRPYPEFVAAAQRTHHDLYEVAAGNQSPPPAPPPEGPKLGI